MSQERSDEASCLAECMAKGEQAREWSHRSIGSKMAMRFFIFAVAALANDLEYTKEALKDREVSQYFYFHYLFKFCLQM